LLYFINSKRIQTNLQKKCWAREVEKKARNVEYIAGFDVFLGANHRIRTDGLLITNELLYQLS
jgi:hypothetical protein